MFRKPRSQERIMTAEEAELILSAHLPTIQQCISTAWRKWEDILAIIPSSHSFPVKSRSRANLVNDYMCAEAETLFDKVPGVYVKKDRGFLFLDFGHQIFLRFKKLDKFGRSSNIRTYQQGSFDNSRTDPQMVFPGMPEPAVTLVAGYQLDRLQTQIENMFISCPFGRDVNWAFEIDVNGIGSVSNITPFPQPAPARTSRVKAKNTPQTGEKESGSE